VLPRSFTKSRRKAQAEPERNVRVGEQDCTKVRRMHSPQGQYKFESAGVVIGLLSFIH
jgi:hypothetical protein